MNYRDDERIVSQRTFQSPGERLRFNVRRHRTRVRSIGFSHAIESQRGHIPISLLGASVRIQQLKVERLNTLQPGNVCDAKDQNLRLKVKCQVRNAKVRRYLNSIDKISRTPDVTYLLLGVISLPEDARDIRALISRTQQREPTNNCR